MDRGSTRDKRQMPSTSNRASTHDQRPEPITTATTADRHVAAFKKPLNERSCQRRLGSGDHEPSGGNRSKTAFENGPCQIGRTTEEKLDDFVGGVKRPSRFLLPSHFFSCFFSRTLSDTPPVRWDSMLFRRASVSSRSGPEMARGSVACPADLPPDSMTSREEPAVNTVPATGCGG